MYQNKSNASCAAGKNGSNMEAGPLLGQPIMQPLHGFPECSLQVSARFSRRRTFLSCKRKIPLLLPWLSTTWQRKIGGSWKTKFSILRTDVRSSHYRVTPWLPKSGVNLGKRVHQGWMKHIRWKGMVVPRREGVCVFPALFSFHRRGKDVIHLPGC